MIHSKHTLISLALSSLIMSGCETIKGHLPDKEKDYQFEQQIPPLVVPKNLSHNEIAKRKVYQEVEPEPENVFVIADEPELLEVDQDTADLIKEEQQQSAVESETTKIDFIEDDIARLRINEPFYLTWRMLSKALTRQMLEITERNQGEKFFIVQYDPNASDFKDETVLDELDFIFDDDHSQEKPYKVQLLEYDSNTDIIILDSLDKPLNDGAGLSLLKQLYQTIKINLTTKE